MKAKDAKYQLDQGVRRQSPEDALYLHMRLSQRRLMLMLPTLMWVGMTLLYKQGHEVRPDILEALRRAVMLAGRFVAPREKPALFARVIKDAEAILTSMNPDNGRQAVMGSAYLIQKLTDEGAVPDPGSQAVLCALAVMTEAEQDPEAGWGFDESVVAKMANTGRERLTWLGYL